MSNLNKFIGIPYKKYGRDFNGCDCYGLVYLFYKYIVGIDLPLYTDEYNHNSATSISTAITRNISSWFQVNKPRFSDCILFNLEGCNTHIGIFLERDRFLHTTESRKESCIERLSHPFWKTRIEGFYRHGKNNR